MPYFKIETNQKMNDAGAEKLSKGMSSFLSGLLGKPERVIMVSVYHSITMMFNENTSPAAYVEMKSIGLTQDKCPGYASAICEFFETALSIPADRVYIDFASIDGKMFGWNKQTF
jgi:phenylpyruvate tautomerase